MAKSQDHNKGKTDLTLRQKYLQSRPKPAENPKKVSKKCIDCHSIFFGFSAEEAKTRLKNHKCPKAK